MKTFQRIIVLFVVLVTVAVFPISAFAANTSDTPYTNFFYDSDQNRYLDPREKTNTTPHFFHITNGSGNTVRIKSLGSRYENFAAATNMTYSNGSIVSYVIARVGTKYSVHNLVYENLSAYQNKYASIAIVGLYDGDAGNVTGVWSPDSSGTYVSARQ